MPDWNNDGKIDYKDDYIYHEILATEKHVEKADSGSTYHGTQNLSNGNGGQNHQKTGEYWPILKTLIIGIVIIMAWEILKLIMKAR